METDFKSIAQALTEDGAKNDITTQLLIPKSANTNAKLVAKENGVICGLSIFKSVFKTLDKGIKVKSFVSDGSRVTKGKILAEIRGNARSILSGERTALNFLQHLSGIATLTNKYVKKIYGTKADIYDTRKTIPGLRKLAKYAVRCGGGKNHRMGLSDMILIKDNHLNNIKDLKRLIAKIKAKQKGIEIELECENIKQVKMGLDAKVDILMLDNMSIKNIKKAVSTVKRNKYSKAQIEISGCVNLKTLRKYAKTGVDRISVGALTHSAPSLDLSLKIL
ncbi:carboxylating nicotinate-nucleotide diphosphorylase [Elusimicrobiota bacterium]